MGWFSNGKCKSKARLDGKTVIITGSNTGIGKITAFDLARRGAHVVMACRDVVKGEGALKELEKTHPEDIKPGQVVVKRLNLTSFSSVRQFAQEILNTELRIDILINNAGVMMCPKELSEDGFELQFATNHLGHFLLTMLLLPRIISSAPARIINVSSKGHILCSSMHFDDINLEKGYKPITAYARSKLANVLFSKELAKRLQGTGVTTFSLHPGVVNTELTRHVDSAFFWGSRVIYHALGNIFMKSPEQGAQTTLYCALEDGLTSGSYFDDCQEVSPSATAQDEKLAAELWEKSIEYIKLDPTFDPFKSNV